MAKIYSVYAGKATGNQGSERHSVLFKRLGKDLKRDGSFNKVYGESKKDDIKLWGTIGTLMVTSFAWLSYLGYTSYIAGSSTAEDAIGTVIGVVFLWLVSFLVCLLVSGFFIKPKLDKKMVELWLFENKDMLNQFFIEFMDSINRKEQPMLKGCDLDSLNGIHIVYDLSRSAALDDRFSIQGYYNVSGDIIKVSLSIAFGQNYTSALVDKYKIDIE